WRRIAMICASVYLLVFIQNLLVHPAEKILLMQPLTFGGDYPTPYHSMQYAATTCKTDIVHKAL
ncbi:MAG: hypothetical protein ACK4RN_18345, partial [Pseudorhodobacter sp.]